jgi:acyl-CoA synthetase (AMP-forming)/AMP-acid ligase II
VQPGTDILAQSVGLFIRGPRMRPQAVIEVGEVIEPVDDDGFIFVSVLGRKKDIIMRGGFNVYPAEFEFALHDHPDALEAAVAGVPHPVLGEEPCADVGFPPGSHSGVAEREGLCGRRPGHFKRPRRWEVVDAVPPNSMGKVLKGELRARVAAGVGAAR